MNDLEKSLWDSAREDAPAAETEERALGAALAALRERGDTAERVEGVEDVHAAVAVRPATRTRAAWIAWGVAGGAAAAGIVALVAARGGLGAAAGAARGDVTASAERVEVTVGGRARAVLEPHARVRWNAPDEVVQDDGDVFYRVEPRGGAPFHVHTAAGDVTVSGTCFRVRVRSMNRRDIKAGAVGAVASAAAFVVVYEGHVSVSRTDRAPGAEVALAAGEAAQAGPDDDAPEKARDPAIAERAFLLRAGESGDAADPAMEANANLAESVAEYKTRLERIAAEKATVERELVEARAKMDASADAGTGAGGRAHGNEVTDEEWKELAKTGSIKMRIPCNWKGGWDPPASRLAELGLAPGDGAAIREASNRLYESTWAQIRPVCVSVIGAEVADRLGVDGCPSFVFNYLRGVDRDAAMEAMRRASEMRAGLLPTPPLDDPSLGPVEKVFLILTGEQRAFEQDLARSFGPEDAHRIVTSDAMCAWGSTWNGAGPRKP